MNLLEQCEFFPFFFSSLLGHLSFSAQSAKEQKDALMESNGVLSNKTADLQTQVTRLREVQTQVCLGRTISLSRWGPLTPQLRQEEAKAA